MTNPCLGYVNQVWHGCPWHPWPSDHNWPWATEVLKTPLLQPWWCATLPQAHSQIPWNWSLLTFITNLPGIPIGDGTSSSANAGWWKSLTASISAKVSRKNRENNKPPCNCWGVYRPLGNFQRCRILTFVCVCVSSYVKQCLNSWEVHIMHMYLYRVYMSIESCAHSTATGTISNGKIVRRHIHGFKAKVHWPFTNWQLTVKSTLVDRK